MQKPGLTCITFSTQAWEREYMGSLSLSLSPSLPLPSSLFPPQLPSSNNLPQPEKENAWDRSLCLSFPRPQSLIPIFLPPLSTSPPLFPFPHNTTGWCLNSLFPIYLFTSLCKQPLTSKSSEIAFKIHFMEILMKISKLQEMQGCIWGVCACVYLHTCMCILLPVHILQLTSVMLISKAESFVVIYVAVLHTVGCHWHPWPLLTTS